MSWFIAALAIVAIVFAIVALATRRRIGSDVDQMVIGDGALLERPEDEKKFYPPRMQRMMRDHDEPMGA